SDLRTGAVEVANGERKATEELEGMVGRQDAVEFAGAGHDRRLHAPELFGEQILALDPFAPAATAVAILQPREKLLGQFRVVFPACRVEGELGDTSAVVTRLVAEQPQLRQTLGAISVDAPIT